MALSQTLPGTQQRDLVTFTIKVNGEAVSTQYQVVSIIVSKEVNKIPLAKLVIFDGDAAAQDFSVSNEPTFIPGTEVEVTAGYHSDETSIFKGIILKHSLKIRSDRSPVVVLDCRDKAVAMTVARKNKYFNDSKDSEAVETIASAYGLETDIEDTSVQLPAIVQYDCTDWDFIVSRMEANGKLCFVDGGKITAKKPDFSSSTILDVVFGATMLEFDADLDARNQYQGLKANTWDYSDQAVITVDAEEPSFEESGNISATDLGSVLNIAAYELFSGEAIKEDELQKLADSRLLKARMSRLRGRVRFEGFGEINPGDLVNIGGVGERFNGKVFLTGVRHEISNGVWHTDVQFGLSNEAFIKQADVHASPAADMIPAIQGLQIGVVTDLEDPDGQDRIRVRLPIIDAAEDGVWSRIASLDAGDTRGTFFRPEVEDEVIVGFLNNDPRNPVVLGMLNSSSKPAPLTAANDNHEKGYVSRSEMKMIFNDDKKSITIETPAGNKVIITEEDKKIYFEDQNGNKLTMNSDGMTMESAKDIILKATGDIKAEGVNISLKSTSELKAEGANVSLKGTAELKAEGASLSLKGSAQAKLEGGIVSIN